MVEQTGRGENRRGIERELKRGSLELIVLHLLAPGEPAYVPLAFDVLRIEAGLVAEITSFVFPELFEAFDLPMSFPADARST